MSVTPEQAAFRARLEQAAFDATAPIKPTFSSVLECLKLAWKALVDAALAAKEKEGGMKW